MALPQTPDPNSTDYIDDEDFIALEIPDAWAGERLDKVLAHFLTDYSRNRIQSWANQGAVLVDGKVVKSRQILRGGEAIRVFPQEMPEQHAFEPEDIPLNCIYEDNHLLVFNKVARMVMHPAAGNWTGTVLNGLLFHYPELAQLPRAGIEVSAHDALVYFEGLLEPMEALAFSSLEVLEVNSKLEIHPAIVNRAPYEDGWVFKVRLRGVPRWLDAPGYANFLKNGAVLEGA
ncbi:MAG: hypothetical protein EBX46_07965 [Burkholderiaceae bacterium]|nr:hypothetical protein [Burkholderiaceae bacterium]